ncbi:MAG: RHS repeat-associated core domain-containing protein [Chlamydiota bacterium]
MQRTTILLFLLIIQFFTEIHCEDEFSNEDLLAELNGAPSGIVNGSVHVITGRYLDTAVDLRMAGASGLTFERSRVGSFFAGWNTNHQSYLAIDRKDYPEYYKKPKFNVIYSGAHGHSHVFSYKAKNMWKLPQKMELTEEMVEKGVTNISSGYISGQTNIKNEHIEFDCKKYNARFINSRGEVHFFSKTREHKVSKLDRIIFPNTIQWHYNYTDRDDLQKIQAINGHEEPCGWITFERAYEPKAHKHAPVAAVRSSDGQIVNYTIKDVAEKKNEFSPSIIRVEGSHIPVVNYEYKKCMLTRRNYPEGRFLGTEYYRSGTHHNGNRVVKVSSKTKFKNRVAYQTAPVGTDQTPIVTHRYFYDIQDQKAGKGKTEVYDSYDRKTVYEYNKSRLDTIAYYSKDNTPQKFDRFYWGKDKDTGNLICRTIENGSGTPLICSSYKYDDKGNVLEERLLGNLSGACDLPIAIYRKQDVIENGVECFKKNYTYVQNQYHLVESESDGKKRITYSYRPNSDLMIRKLTWVGETIVQREYFQHDRFGSVTREIRDDGCAEDQHNMKGVTERHITEYDHSNTPVVGLPSQVIRKVWNPETESEEILGKTGYSYTKQGKITEERRYDSMGNCVGTTAYCHDRFGNIIGKVDPLGYTYSWHYDDNGNKTTERGPRQDVHKEFRYDYSNRLVAEEEVHSNGLRLKRSYSYDRLGNKKQDYDIYGNVTEHEYDRFCRKIHSSGPDGTILETITYNALNQATSKSDACGHLSQYSYNIRGAPVEIIHPDGTKESNLYNIDGTLKQKVERDGKTTIYTYDHLDRELTADVYDSQGAHLYQTTKEYNAFHLIKETDPEGAITSYDYDHCGRIIKKAKGDRIQEYGYDSLGRKSTQIEKVSESDGVITDYEYDLLDRVIGTTIKNLSGKVQSWESCQYDHAGNKICVATERNGQHIETRTEYDARGKVVKLVDPEGRESHFLHRYDYINTEGQCVSYREEVDPTGSKTLFIGDLYGRDQKIVRIDPQGKTQHITHFNYDPNGNKLEKVDEVYARGKHIRNFVCKWEYDVCGKPIRQYEAYGTALQKETQITYNQHGKKSSVTKPDGVAVSFQYGANGLLENVYSSDGTIHYEYNYDIKGNPTKVNDHVNGSYTERLYDCHSHVIYERQGTGIAVATHYDPLGRVKSVQHPDGMKVEYHYDGIQLKSVIYLDASGNQLFDHEYSSYDTNGKLVESALPKNLGSIKYQYDPLGRMLGIESPYWSEVVDGYDDAGNFLGKEVTDHIGVTSDRYQYDPLNQLCAEEGSVSHRYEHDSLNNRVGKDGEEHEVNVLNQLTHDGSRHYDYNPNGNIVCISDHGRSMKFTYDAFDRLVEIDRDGQVIKCRYDEHHRRLSKGSEQYLYHDCNEILAVNQEGVIHQRRVLGTGLGGEIGAAVLVELDRDLYVPLHDHNGNVVTLVDADKGEVAECYRYSAYGEELVDTSGSKNPWRFSSKRVDEETQMVFFGRRYYIPEVGRWLTADPLGDYDGSNLYAYVKNRPLTHFDIYGLLAQGISRSDWRYAPIRYAGQCLSWCGMAGESLFKHLLPPSPLRLLGEGFFGLMQGKQPTTPSWCVKSQFTTIGDKKCPDGIAQMCGTGIMTEHSAGCKTTGDISEYSGGYQVTLLNNPTRGFVTDMIYCLFEKLGSSNPHIKQMQEHIQNTYNELKKEHDHPMIYLHAHSRGGMEVHLATKDLPQEIKQSLYIMTYGSATIIPREDYGDAENFVNRRDLVPLTDYFGMRKYQDSVTFTGYASNSLLWTDDHSIDNPGYRAAMTQCITDYQTEPRWSQ